MASQAQSSIEPSVHSNLGCGQLQAKSSSKLWDLAAPYHSLCPVLCCQSTNVTQVAAASFLTTQEREGEEGP
jgi:hypothetical protein